MALLNLHNDSIDMNGYYLLVNNDDFNEKPLGRWESVEFSKFLFTLTFTSDKKNLTQLTTYDVGVNYANVYVYCK